MDRSCRRCAQWGSRRGVDERGGSENSAWLLHGCNQINGHAIRAASMISTLRTHLLSFSEIPPEQWHWGKVLGSYCRLPGKGQLNNAHSQSVTDHVLFDIPEPALEVRDVDPCVGHCRWKYCARSSNRLWRPRQIAAGIVTNHL